MLKDLPYKFTLSLEELLAPLKLKSYSIKSISEDWNNQPPKVKIFFKVLAKVAIERHKAMYPEYVYQPHIKQTAVSEENFIQISKFLPIFSDITQIFKKISDIYYDAEYNKDELDQLILVDVERRKRENQILRNDIEDLNNYLKSIYVGDTSKQNASSNIVWMDKLSR
ncbi:28255_t:CDS:2, partial [Dentiscutata erythropus]